MCRRVKCSTCGLTTWAGCGAHVDQVMSGVAEAQRCRCDIGTKGSSNVAPSGEPVARRSFLDRLRGS